MVVEIHTARFCYTAYGFFISSMYGNGIEVVFAMQVLPGFCKCITQRLCERGNTLSNQRKAIRAMVYGIHSGHIGQKCLRGTDIGSSLFSFDVLLTCLQRHAECAVLMRINADAYDAAGYLAFEIVLGRKESRVRATKAQRNAEALCGT